MPDRLHPDPAYIESNRVGGPCHHEAFYHYRTLPEVFTRAGFQVKLLEYWDEAGNFVAHPWDAADGHVKRSRQFDPRNRDGKLAMTSVIIDAVKPASAA